MDTVTFQPGIPPRVILAARILSVVIGIWIAAMLFNFDIRVYSRIVLLQFVTGSSWAKPFIFLVIVEAFLVLLSIPLIARPPSSLVRNSVLFGAITVPVVAHAWYSLKFGVPFFGRSISFHDSEISTSEVVHIHVFKGALYKIIELLNLTGVRTSYDAGEAFGAFLPTWFYFFGIVNILAAGAVLYSDLVAKLTRWDLTQRSLFFPLYLISAGIFLKATVDGGPFDSQSAVIIPILAVLLFSDRVPLSVTIKRGAIALISCVALDALLFHLARGQYWRGLPASFSLYFWLSNISLLNSLLFDPRRWTVRFVLAALANVAIPFMLLRENWYPLEYEMLMTRLHAGDAVLFRDDRYVNRELPLWGAEGPLKIYELRVAGESSVFDLYRQFAISPGFHPFSPIGYGCSLGGPFSRHADLYLYNGTLDRCLKTSSFGDLAFDPCESSEGCAYHLNMKIKGCIPDEAYDIMVNRLDGCGVKSGILLQTQEVSPPPPWPRWLIP